MPSAWGASVSASSAKRPKTEANDHVNLAFIGLGQQAMYLLNGFITLPGVKVVAGADADPAFWFPDVRRACLGVCP